MEQLTLAYPDSPGFKAPGTSEEAARSMRVSAKALRSRALVTLRDYPFGLTADQVAEKMCRSILSIRPRISELKREGKITDSGIRRKNDSGKNAVVWVYL